MEEGFLNRAACRRGRFLLIAGLIAGLGPGDARAQGSRLLVLPFSPEGLAESREARECSGRLRGVAAGMGVPVVAGELAESALGSFGGDFSACLRAEDCERALARSIGASHVLGGRLGRMGPNGYLMLTLRDSEGCEEAYLRTRSWRGREEEDAALESLAYEVNRRLAPRLPRGGLANLRVIDKTDEAPLEPKSQYFAMTVGLLPGAGMMYLGRYDLATAYFGSECAGGLLFFYFLGADDARAAVAAALGAGALKLVEIAHSGAVARRINNQRGFLQIGLRTDEGTRGSFAPTIAYARRF